jgi:hypothetical protein
MSPALTHRSHIFPLSLHVAKPIAWSRTFQTIAAAGSFPRAASAAAAAASEAAAASVTATVSGPAAAFERAAVTETSVIAEGKVAGIVALGTAEPQADCPAEAEAAHMPTTKQCQVSFSSVH